MLFAQETWINATAGYSIGESDVYETFTDNRGELYRAMVRSYGRCTGKVYVDTPQGPRAVGWVFCKRQRYDDSPETFLLETWVTVHTSKPTRTIEYHYADAA